MAKDDVRPVSNATTGLFEEMIRTSVEKAVWAIRRHNEALGIGRDCTARAEARQKRIDAATKAEGVMPSDAPRVLAEFYASRPITWAVAEPQPASTAKSLPGALDVASGGHRFGGWGATRA